MKSKIVSIIAILAIALTGCSSSSSQTEDIKTSEKQGERTTTVTTTTPTPTSKITEETSSVAQAAEKIPDEKIPDITDKRENIAYVRALNADGCTMVNVSLKDIGDQTGLKLADKEDRKLTLTGLDNPFYFNGIAICPCDEKQTEENDSVVTHRTAAEGSYFYAELGEKFEVKNNFGSYTDYPVNAVAFDMEYVKDSEDFSFGYERIDMTHFKDVFHLGDSKETVEKILGKGYEQNGYSFYKGTSSITNTQVYFIVHYKSDNEIATVDKVFIIGRDSLYDLKGRELIR